MLKFALPLRPVRCCDDFACVCTKNRLLVNRSTYVRMDEGTGIADHYPALAGFVSASTRGTQIAAAVNEQLFI